MSKVVLIGNGKFVGLGEPVVEIRNPLTVKDLRIVFYCNTSKDPYCTVDIDNTGKPYYLANINSVEQFAVHNPKYLVEILNDLGNWVLVLRGPDQGWNVYYNARLDRAITTSNRVGTESSYFGNAQYIRDILNFDRCEGETLTEQGRKLIFGESYT